MNLRIRIVEIKGSCPVYQKGDDFMLEEGYRLKAPKDLCMHSLAALMPFYNALRFAEPASLGLAGKDKESAAYVQCPDACPYTGGGTAVFEISRFKQP